MNRTVVGLFDDREHADQAVDDLLRANVAREKISILATNAKGDVEASLPEQGDNLAAEGAATGLTAGAVVGGIVGLLAGAGLAVMPLGLAVAGPLAGLIAGGAAGAATGGILGGLIGLGIPEDHAHAYIESVRHGSVMVSVQANDEETTLIEDILDRDGAVNVHQRSAALRELGRAEAHQKDEMSPEEWSKLRERWSEGEGVLEHEQNVMQRERTRIANYVRPEPPSLDKNVPLGRRAVNREEDADGYQQIFNVDVADPNHPGYSFGYERAADPKYVGRDWSAVETELRSEWETRDEGAWEEMSESIRSGWNRRHVAETSGGAELL